MATRGTQVDQQSEETKKKRITKQELLDSLKMFSFIKPYKWYFFGAFFMLFLSSLLTMVFPAIAGVLTDIANGTPKYGLDLNNLGGVLVVILLTQGLISFTQVILNAVVSERAMADLRMALYAKMVSLPIFFFEENRIGELMSRISSDVAQLQTVFSSTLLSFFRQILILIIGITILIVTTPKLSGYMLLTFPFVVVGALFFGRYLRKISKNRQKELANTNVVVEESLHNIKSVKAFTNETFEADRYNGKIRKLVDISLKLARVRGAFSTFIVVLLFGGIFFILWLGAIQVSNGTMTIGELVSFIAYTAFIGGAIGGLGNFYSEIITAVGGTERIREILNKESELNINSKERVELNGNIKFENVHFSYPTRKDFEILKGINFEIPKGNKIALVGQSGSGKSTIVQLLMRYYELDQGKIIVDGNDITKYDFTAFRKNVAIVPQEIMLFGGTLRENILYGNPQATEDELMEAAKKANCYNFIMNFPESFETTVGERGVKLSGGQKQRVAIARAVLKNPSILILDEATSALDAESERLVQDALENLMEDRTSIIIAHRLATIKNVDEIYVIEDGQIEEKGTHDELILKENGKYAALAKLQYE